MLKKNFITFILSASFFAVIAKEYQIYSPNGKISVTILVNEKIEYSVFFEDIRVLEPSSVSFTFKQAPPLSTDFKVLKEENYSTDEEWVPVLKRYETIRDNHKGIRLYLQEKKFPKRLLNLDFRVFDHGVAFRNEFPEQFGARKNVITDELTVFNFADNFICWAANYGGYDTHQETEYFRYELSEITDKMVTGLPLTFKVSENIYAAITEADLEDYAGMYLKPYKNAGKFALRSQLASRHNQPEEGDKVEFTNPHKTPWRVIMMGETPGDLVESEIIQNLNDSCEIEDPSWIQPGISAWDHWWSGEVKMEQTVIYEYIDLASEMGWPYMLIDWQWYGQYDRPEVDIMEPAHQLNMPEILKYAENKNVKCWLWLYWTDVDKADWDAACALYESWGIAGVKIDFMARDDQEMVNWYHRIVKTAAKHRLMVDFHGAYKPTGWRRTYPNLMTREGVLGNEYNKWSLRITPEHMCTLPFTRMLAGPMDYTPGGFLNRNPDKFLNGTPTHVMGTRANTLAQFVIYDSPYQVACDHPDNYKDEVGVEFLKKVEAVWDDTKVINGEIGEYITMARQFEENWFIGSMTNSEERKLIIQLDFLPQGKYKMVSYSDTQESKEYAEIALAKESLVSNQDVIIIKMVPGGGFAAWLEPIDLSD
jgi:alpha-glucosidase